MRSLRLASLAFIALVCALSLPGLLGAQSVAERTEGLDSHEGFVTLHWDDDEGALLLEIHRLDEDFLYLQSLATVEPDGAGPR